MSDAPRFRILPLALPAAGSALVLLLYRWVDTMWVKGLGAEAQAALAVSTNTVWMFSGVAALVSMGLGALVARYVGAGRHDAARYVASQGVRWAVALGGVVALVGWFGAPLVFEAANARPEVAEPGIAYTRVYWMGGLAMLVSNASDAVFRAHGDTRTPLLFGATGILCNAGLDPLMIFGWGPVPAMGVAGAAWATVISASIAGVLSLRALHRRRMVGRERPPDETLRLVDTTLVGRPRLFGLDTAVFVRVARVGLPVLASSLVFNSLYLVLMRIAQEAGGPAAQAGLGVGWNGEGVAFVLCLGWSAAAASLVGRNLGAGRPEEASRCAWSASFQCAALCAVWGAVLFVFDRPIASLFTDDPAVLEHGATYFRVVAACLAPQALEVVLDGAFGGAGHTVPPLVITTTFTLLRIPLAWWLAIHLGLGAAGIWWTIMATATLRGAACAVWFARGTWKTRTV